MGFGTNMGKFFGGIGRFSSLLGSGVFKLFGAFKRMPFIFVVITSAILLLLMPLIESIKTGDISHLTNALMGKILANDFALRKAMINFNEYSVANNFSFWATIGVYIHIFLALWGLFIIIYLLYRLAIIGNSSISIPVAFLILLVIVLLQQNYYLVNDIELEISEDSSFVRTFLHKTYPGMIMLGDSIIKGDILTPFYSIKINLPFIGNNETIENG